MFKACVRLWPVLLLFSSLTAQAAKKWDYRNTFESYLYYTNSSPLDNGVNPGNQILGLPGHTGVVDLRDDFNILTSKTKWVVRPRWTLTSTKTEKQNPSSSYTTSQGKLDLTSGYLDWDLSEKWKAVVGLQVYQWGPGEFINPSNVFFHFSNDQRSFFYVQKGLVLARLNWTPSPNWSLVLIDEPISNNEQPFQVEKDFQPKSTLKIDYHTDGSSSLGAVVGTEGYGRPFFGEYFTWYLTDAVSFYADLRHLVGSYTYDPSMDSNGFIQLVETDPNSGQMFTIADWGLRYEGRVDFRMEWFYNGVGWDKEALKYAIQGITYPNPYLVNNLKRYSHSGLELPGQNYFYLSLRIPDLGKKKDASLYMRNILSAQDQSGVFQVSADKALSDSWTGYLEVLSSYGADMTEFRLLYGVQGSVGLRWAL
ncbi:hypothetical protein [Bdellovibrio svalbardensis]|uniref:Uncharacterized protein n=1 Tax=Bdellovibrio svalbardensis TaxID=2972972 RepID=A0ABT6DF45_9BACT|nr:hypothetical protein [Bdellovibrio svalbardensis]MDG0815471.1 hypothetical protein [Bdellovibrio svalbardensis]